MATVSLRHEWPGTTSTEENGASSSMVEAAVISEVIDWLESAGCDDFWAPRAKRSRNVSHVYQYACYVSYIQIQIVFPTANQLFAQLKAHPPTRTPLSDAEAFDTLYVQASYISSDL